MPERVINDAVFQYKDAEGRLLTAVRGVKVDIPEGEDLARGDKVGRIHARWQGTEAAG